MGYLFWTVIGILILIQVVAYVLWRIAFHSPNKTQNDDFHLSGSEQAKTLKDTIDPMIRSLNAIPYETVEIVSKDGLRLRGRLYLNGETAPLAICFHGYRGTPSRDFAGGAKLYLDMGLNVLLIEQRAHLSSEGKAITLGIKEREDCVAWIRYALERFGSGARILLSGISMGATTVLLAAGMGLPDQVKGIAADCAYLSPKEILTSVLTKMKLPVSVVFPLLRIGAWLYSGVNLCDRTADVRTALSETSIPICLIHGEEDQLVPADMGKQIQLSASDTVELHIFPGADHGMSFLIDQERYTRIVREFLSRLFPPESDHKK